MNILDHIGNTPLLRLNHVADSLGVDIYVKCEFTNPGGSIKDRMALCMIEEAEKRGDLKPGGTIVDQSTGNTGPALSFVGAVKGYEVQIFLPAQLSSAYNSADRIRIARLYGAHVTPIDLKQHMQKADQLQGVERAAAFVAIRMKQCYDLQQSDASNWWANQLCNVDNTRAHREHTGREILDQMDGPIDGWVASVGTGGTLLGVAQTLKETYPELKVAGVLPTDDPRIEWVRSRAVHKALENFGGPQLRFVMEDLLDSNVMDREITIENDDAEVVGVENAQKHMAEILEMALDIALEKKDPKKKLERRRKRQAGTTAKSRSDEVTENHEPAKSRYVASEVSERVHERDSYAVRVPLPQGEPQPLRVEAEVTRKHAIPLLEWLDRERVTRRDDQCIYKGRDGRRCTARVGLQLDHKKPYGIFQSNEESILTLLCALCRYRHKGHRHRHGRSRLRHLIFFCD